MYCHVLIAIHGDLYDSCALPGNWRAQMPILERSSVTIVGMDTAAITAHHIDIDTSGIEIVPHQGTSSAA